ncbi:alpha/beta fold hydrolase [Spirosoma soli]|uniref:Alpha/beta fold hydrolase n=1 Tax=Spirosoma soli TaxID=1770529 RepID=A0ABW5M2U5_9BACT
MTDSIREYDTIINGITIHCMERPGAGELTILFVHGRCMSVRVWEKQFASPLLRSSRLVAFDLPGHGTSGNAAGSSEYSLESYRQMLIELIAHCQLTQFFLVGLSLGGHIVLQALPKLHGCRGVFAMTMPILKPLEAERMYTRKWLDGRALQPNPLPADVDEYVNHMLRFAPDYVPDFLKTDFNRTDPAVHIGLLQTIINENYEDELKLIENNHIPVALAAGVEDQIHELSYLKTLDLPIWRHEPQFVDKAGHLLPWENPVTINELLASFIEDCA